MNCYTCGHSFHPTDKVLRQHGVVVCANVNCSWRKYQPPKGVPPNWRLGYQEAVEYRKLCDNESNRLKQLQINTAKANIKGLSFVEKIKLLFT